MKPRRSQPIRVWLISVLIVAFVTPALVIGLLIARRDAPGGATGEVAATLRADVARWGDPTWQATIAPTLATRGVQFALIDGAGRELYRSTADLYAAETTVGPGLITRRIVVTDNAGATLGTAYLYFTQDFREVWFIPLAGLGTIALVLLAVGWFTDRAIVRPLAATAAAAGRVAEGDLDVRLPGSPVREVAEVNDAFVGMSAALRAALAHQAELEQERRLFIGAVAHDLRTPLFALRGYLDGLGRGLADTPEKAARYLAAAGEKATALERLIADLFEYTRLEYLDQTPRRDPVDLGALLRRLVEGVQPQAEAKGVTLTLNGPPDAASGTGDAIEGDAHQLTRAVENLLDNALRHTPAGGRIEIAWRREEGRAVFTVRDTGGGIAPQDLPHIFTPLYRGESSRNRRTGGAGLGLTTARRIMLAHGGDLAAANAPGGGAIFTGSLALATAEPGGSRLEGAERAHEPPGQGHREED
jgi:signal transduction histidine kinase